MRVTLDHKEEKGLLSTQNRVECEVIFSEEEKAIIRERGLREYSISVSGLITADTGEVRRRYALKAGLACVLAIVSILFSTGNNAIAPAIFFVACGYALYCGYRFLRPGGGPDTKITVGTLLERGRFSVETGDVATSKFIIEQIEKELRGIKGVFGQNVEPVARRSVEI